MFPGRAGRVSWSGVGEVWRSRRPISERLHGWLRGHVVPVVPVLLVDSLPRYETENCDGSDNPEKHEAREVVWRASHPWDPAGCTSAISKCEVRITVTVTTARMTSAAAVTATVDHRVNHDASVSSDAAYRSRSYAAHVLQPQSKDAHGPTAALRTTPTPPFSFAVSSLLLTD